MAFVLTVVELEICADLLCDPLPDGQGLTPQLTVGASVTEDMSGHLTDRASLFGSREGRTMT